MKFNEICTQKVHTFECVVEEASFGTHLHQVRRKEGERLG